MALLLGSPMALAEGAKPSSTNTIAQPREKLPSTGQIAPHYEWQYHYVSRHARVEGYWGPVCDRPIDQVSPVGPKGIGARP